MLLEMIFRQLKLPDNESLKKMEKVELHRHIEGSLRFSTLLEIARKIGIEMPSNRQLQQDKFLVTTPMKDLTSVLNKFWMTQSVLCSEEILTRVTFECIEDAVAEGIRILELRYAPEFIKINHEQLTWEKIHQAILKGIKLTAHLPIAVGLIGIVQRNLPLSLSEKVMHFIVEHKDSFIGVDLADDEDFIPAKNFEKIFSLAHKENIPITIHAGESNSSQAVQNVIDAIQVLGAKRIGHGLQIFKSAEAKKIVRENKIPLEICVTSNWLTAAIPNITSHPIHELKSERILVTVNSDDPGIFGINLTNEYSLLKEKYNFTEADFMLANDIAAQASFISISKKQKYWPRPIHLI